MCRVMDTTMILTSLRWLFSVKTFHTSCKFLVKDDEMVTWENSSSPWGDECRKISYANLFCHTCTSFSVGMNECAHVTRTSGIFSHWNVCVFRLLCVPRNRRVQPCTSVSRTAGKGLWFFDARFYH
jgi:hypothetical protein